MEPHVTRIEMKDSEIFVGWDEDSKQSSSREARTLSSIDPPRPEFSRAWGEMKEYFRAMLELPKNFQDRLHLSRVDISRKEEYISVKMTGTRAMLGAKGSKAESTPQYSWDTSADAKDQSGKKNRMTKECYESLIFLESKALLYTEGQRSQLDLFEGGAEAGEDAPLKTAL